MLFICQRFFYFSREMPKYSVRKLLEKFACEASLAPDGKRAKFAALAEIKQPALGFTTALFDEIIQPLFQLTFKAAFDGLV